MKKLEDKKVCQDDAQIAVFHKNWFDQFKVSTVAAAITSLICASVPTYAADLEIYKVPEDSTGVTTLMLMLDTSGSMAWNMGDTKTASAGNSRLDILKKGLKDVLEGTATTPRVDDKIVMGLATFAGDMGYVRIPAQSLGTKTGNEVLEATYKKPIWTRYSQTGASCGKRCTPPTTVYYNKCIDWDINNYNCLKWSGDTTSSTGYTDSNPYKYTTNNDCRYGNNNDCRFVYEEINKYRDETHRDTLLTTINGLSASGGTPTPYAYAEAAAYMMGTRPTTTIKLQSYFVRSNGNYLTCNAYASTGVCSDGWYGDRWGDWYTNFPTSNSSYTKGTSATVVGYTGNYYYTQPSFSGFSSDSVPTSKNGSVYKAPASITAQLGDSDAAKAKRECSGQGIYFLTDGEPEPNGTVAGDKSGTAYELMSSALGTKGDLFSCKDSQLGKRTPYKNSANSWTCIGNFAESLLTSTKNPVGLEIKTAVVGFSSSFSSDTNNDVNDAKQWGTIGKGKWYVGTNSQSVVDSINNFIDEINKDIPSMSTGSSTIPVDALNPEVIQPYTYFPQFEPKIKPEDTQQLWFGNVKKYYVVNNGVSSSANGGAANTVVLKSKLQDLVDIWAKSGVTYGESTAIFKKGGALSQLKLGTETSTTDGTTTTIAGRKLLTDYVFDNTKDEPVSRSFDLNRIDYTYTTNEKTRTDEAGRVRGLMALLGYNISSDTATNGLDLATLTANLRQMGSVYHSLPTLLTQEGKAVASQDATTKKISIDTTGRKDYVMFGTTQGVLSVVDATTGVEKFGFVPTEMIEKQSETFKENAGTLAGGKNALYYGMDGEWVAHTVYVTKSDGTLTVNGAVRNVVGSTTDKENLQGKQWVYGGMRMGGRSYYALDLTDIDKPKLKFHIDPNTGKVYSKANPEGKSVPEIEHMAQSWSKPKLDYVNWKGQRKLVMFVGGGYDAGGDAGDGLWVNNIRVGYAGYEAYNYTQTNKKGAGVYMFDANSGDLLWYADANTPSTPTDPTGGGTTLAESTPHLVNADLKYSVASEIKTVDRNNDGMVDHIYFGDLAGQAFRVDFDRNNTQFNSQITKILDLHQTGTTVGTSPRFYLPPVFTAHHSAGKKEGADVVVVSFVSGNKSSPLLATSDSPTITGKTDPLGLQFDAVYAIYDYEIHPDGQFYPNSRVAARTLAETTSTTASTSQLKYISNDDIARADTDNTLVKGAVANSDSGWGGWYYRFEKKFSATGTNRENAGASIIKGLTRLIAMEGNLYVTMYDASNNGTSSSCGAGVKGHSFTQRLCLPTGVCGEDANYVYNLGAGIVNLDVGPTGDGLKSLVVPDPDDVGVGCVGAACVGKPKFIAAGGPMHFIPNRWYERFGKAD